MGSVGLTGMAVSLSWGSSDCRNAAGGAWSLAVWAALAFAGAAWGRLKSWACPQVPAREPSPTRANAMAWLVRIRFLASIAGHLLGPTGRAGIDSFKFRN